MRSERHRSQWGISKNRPCSWAWMVCGWKSRQGWQPGIKSRHQDWLHVVVGLRWWRCPPHWIREVGVLVLYECDVVVRCEGEMCA